jgi:hypothetical protein
MLGAPRQATALVVATMLLSVLWPASRADAGQSAIRVVCRTPARVYDTPGGIVVGFIGVGQRVHVLRRSADDRHWVRVYGTLGVVGWMNDRVLCNRR